MSLAGAHSVDERKAGVWKRYHPNNALWDEGAYAEDRRTGEWKAYDADGALVRTTRHGARPARS